MHNPLHRSLLLHRQRQQFMNTRHHPLLHPLPSLNWPRIITWNTLIRWPVRNPLPFPHRNPIILPYLKPGWKIHTINLNLTSSASIPFSLYSSSLTFSIAQATNLGSLSTTSMYLFLVSIASTNLKNCGYFKTTECSKSSGKPNSYLAILTCSNHNRPELDIIINFLNLVTASGIWAKRASFSCTIWLNALRVKRQYNTRWTGCSYTSKTWGNLRIKAPASKCLNPNLPASLSRREMGSVCLYWESIKDWNF